MTDPQRIDDLNTLRASLPDHAKLLAGRVMIAPGTTMNGVPCITIAGVMTGAPLTSQDAEAFLADVVIIPRSLTQVMACDVPAFIENPEFPVE